MTTEPHAWNTAPMTDAEFAEAQQYGRVGLACTIAERSSTWPSWPWRPCCWPGRSTPGSKRTAWSARGWSLRLVALFLLVVAAHVAVSFRVVRRSGVPAGTPLPAEPLTFGGWLWRYASGMPARWRWDWP